METQSSSLALYLERWVDLNRESQVVRAFQAWSLAQDSLKPEKAEFGPQSKGGRVWKLELAQG